MKTTWEKIEEVLNKNAITMHETEKQNGNEYITELEFWSDLQEDIIIDIHHNNTPDEFIKELRKYTYHFDPEEHARNLIGARNNSNGIPSSDLNLYKDAEEIKAFLEYIIEELEETSLTETEKKNRTLRKQITELIKKINELYADAQNKSNTLYELIEREKDEKQKDNYIHTQALTADLIRHLRISKDQYDEMLNKIPIVMISSDLPF